MDDVLYELLFRCTLRISAGRDLGTGSFVAPGLVLTCAHVVADVIRANGQVILHDEQRALRATVEDCRPAPYPDLALLHVDLADHPYLTIDPDLRLGDELLVCGYPPNYPGGDAITAVYEGPTWLDAAKSQRLLKFKEGQVVPGLSGAPLFNIRTSGVCGVVKSTRDRYSDLGGRAVPVEVARELFQLFPTPDRRWSDALRHGRAGGRSLSPPRVEVIRYDTPTNTLNRPEQLFGRDPLCADVDGRRSCCTEWPALARPRWPQPSRTAAYRAEPARTSGFGWATPMRTSCSRRLLGPSVSPRRIRAAGMREPWRSAGQSHARG